MGPLSPLAHHTLKAVPFQLAQVRRREILAVQVTTQDRSRFGRIPLQIGEDFVQLRLLKLSHAAALQMHVVDKQQTMLELELRYQSDPAPQPALHKRNGTRNPAVRLPKTGLRLEPQYPRSANGQSRQSRLANKR